MGNINTTIIAHKNEKTGKTHSLEEHLLMVAEQSKNQSKYPYTSYLLGILHDIGKADPLWQQYIRGTVGGTVNHSSAGAKYIYNYDGVTGQFSKMYAKILAYVITSHHGQYDLYVQGNEDVLQRRLNYEVTGNYHYQGTVEFLDRLAKNNSFTLDDVIQKSYHEIETWANQVLTKKSSHNKQWKRFELTALVRYLLSILKDEDIQDSITWEDRHTYNNNTDWIEECNKIEDLYSTFTQDTELNQARTDISEQALAKYNQFSKGVVELQLPTGAGKTMTAMRYAVHHNKYYKKERIIYVAPFLSILEQNAQVIRDLVQNDTIISEHHTNISETVETLQREITHVGYNTVWEEPIILTTMVQFFNTLFGVKADEFRRFSNLQNSVIILDEVQSIPTKFYYLFNTMISILARDYNCVVILCTATQPNLESESITQRIQFREPKELVVMTEEQTQLFKRVTDHYLGVCDSDTIISHARTHYIHDQLSMLFIFSTKKTVKKYYELLQQEFGDEYKVDYLTTDLYAKHRLEVINSVKEDLENNIPIIVVSTNLVEAGVDFDFDVVYRDIAPVSSLIQARGRCNRNGMGQTGHFNIVDIRDRGLMYLDDLYTGAGITQTLLLGKGTDAQFNIEDYNDSYYSILNNKDNNSRKMETRFTLNNLDYYAYDLLTSNKNLTVKSTLKQAFKTAGQNIKLIDNETVGVIVETEDNQELIDELRNKYKYGIQYGMYELIKKLQVYTINLYNIDKMSNCVEVMGEEVYVLRKEYYDGIVGLNITTDILLDI